MLNNELVRNPLQNYCFKLSKHGSEQEKMQKSAFLRIDEVFELFHYIPEGLREASGHGINHGRRDVMVVGLCDATGDTSEGIGVTAEGDCETDSGFEVVAIEESEECGTQGG